MDISPNGVAFISDTEQLRLTAYQDIAGVWTIGYGHTGPDVHEGMTITPEQALDLRRADLSRFVDAVNGNVRVPLTQNQFDALVSFAYNNGVAAFVGSDLLSLLNSGDRESAMDELERYNKATVGGKLVYVRGLARRRHLERLMFEDRLIQ